MLAGAIVLLTQGHDVVSLFDAFWSERLSYKVAWTALVLVPFTLLPPTVYLCDLLAWRRNMGYLLALPPERLPINLKDLPVPQAENEVRLHSLAHSGWKYAIGMSRQWLNVLPFQRGGVRARQQSLRERHAPALEWNRSIERLLQELDGKPKDIERALDEIGGGDSALSKII